jgi:hypothetical protein
MSAVAGMRFGRAFFDWINKLQRRSAYYRQFGNGHWSRLDIQLPRRLP